jgi:hypothetical protein
MCVRLYFSQYVPEEQQVQYLPQRPAIQYVQQPQQQVDTSYTNGLKSHTLIAEDPTTTVRAYSSEYT